MKVQQLLWGRVKESINVSVYEWCLAIIAWRCWETAQAGKCGVSYGSITLSTQTGASTCNRNKNAWECIHDHRIMYLTNVFY